MLLALASMTGFAHVEAGATTASAGLAAQEAAPEWMWEIRSVNGRGLELRLRLPGGLESLEPGLRAAAARRLRRGSVQATLTIRRPPGGAGRIDRAWLDTLMSVAAELRERVPGAAPLRPELLLGLPGVLHSETGADRMVLSAAQQSAVADGFAVALEQLAAAREAEGARLGQVIAGLLDRLAEAHRLAGELAAAQPAAHQARLERLVGELLRGVTAVPEDRLAQEVALLAARSDVREEMDRLASHLAAARGLLGKGGAVGRELDFLVQEFMREANTLCSKSGDIGLTGAGLQMKVIIEQIREQVQNLE